MNLWLAAAWYAARCGRGNGSWKGGLGRRHPLAPAARTAWPPAPLDPSARESARVTSVSSILAITFSRPPQRRQVSMSIANSARVRRRRSPPRTCDAARVRRSRSGARGRRRLVRVAASAGRSHEVERRPPRTRVISAPTSAAHTVRCMRGRGEHIE